MGVQVGGWGTVVCVEVQAVDPPQCISATTQTAVASATSRSMQTLATEVQAASQQTHTEVATVAMQACDEYALQGEPHEPTRDRQDERQERSTEWQDKQEDRGTEWREEQDLCCPEWQVNRSAPAVECPTHHNAPSLGAVKQHTQEVQTHTTHAHKEVQCWEHLLQREDKPPLDQGQLVESREELWQSREEEMRHREEQVQSKEEQIRCAEERVRCKDQELELRAEQLRCKEELLRAKEEQLVNASNQWEAIGHARKDAFQAQDELLLEQEKLLVAREPLSAGQSPASMRSLEETLQAVLAALSPAVSANAVGPVLHAVQQMVERSCSELVTQSMRPGATNELAALRDELTMAHHRTRELDAANIALRQERDTTLSQAHEQREQVHVLSLRVQTLTEDVQRLQTMCHQHCAEAEDRERVIKEHQEQSALHNQLLEKLQRDHADREQSLESVILLQKQRIQQLVLHSMQCPPAARPDPPPKMVPEESIMEKFARVHHEVVVATLRTDKEKANLLTLRQNTLGPI